MNKRWLVGGFLAVVLASVPFGVGAWRDTHPSYTTTAHELKAGYSVELPAGWLKPYEETDLVDIKSSNDLREGSLDQFRWGIAIHDYGVHGEVEKVLEEMRSGYDTATRIKNIVLANGVVAKTWTFWEPMGELNQEHRAYIFKAPNGHVYSGWQPMARDWRTKRRYDNIFREVLGSMKFK